MRDPQERPLHLTQSRHIREAAVFLAVEVYRVQAGLGVLVDLGRPLFESPVVVAGGTVRQAIMAVAPAETLHLVGVARQRRPRLRRQVGIPVLRIRAAGVQGEARIRSAAPAEVPESMSN
jgi:hypothetical protein